MNKNILSSALLIFSLMITGISSHAGVIGELPALALETAFKSVSTMSAKLAILEMAGEFIPKANLTMAQLEHGFPSMDAATRFKFANQLRNLKSSNIPMNQVSAAVGKEMDSISELNALKSTNNAGAEVAFTEASSAPVQAVDDSAAIRSGLFAQADKIVDDLSANTNDFIGTVEAGLEVNGEFRAVGLTDTPLALNTCNDAKLDSTALKNAGKIYRFIENKLAGVRNQLKNLTLKGKQACVRGVAGKAMRSAIQEVLSQTWEETMNTMSEIVTECHIGEGLVPFGAAAKAGDDFTCSIAF